MRHAVAIMSSIESRRRELSARNDC